MWLKITSKRLKIFLKPLGRLNFFTRKEITPKPNEQKKTPLFCALWVKSRITLSVLPQNPYKQRGLYFFITFKQKNGLTLMSAQGMT